jgi:hypothetical protein
MKKYCAPKITCQRIDTEINLVLMSEITPPPDPEMMLMMEEMDQETNGGIYSQFMNPMKWFK